MKKLKRLVCLSITACLLTGCGVYRNYSCPDMELAAQYRSVETTDTTTIASLPWRELFTDSRLQTLIEQGLERNTDLNIARLRVEEAKAVLMNARLSYLPSLALNPEAGISRYDGTTSKTYNLAASASWELDIFGKNTNAKRGARAALEGSKDYVQAVQTGLIASIADNYYTLLMLDSQLAIGEQTLESWEKSIRTLEALKRAGQSNDAAVLQARANRMALESSVLSIRKSISEMENVLSALLALPSQTIERSFLEDAVFPETVSVGVPVQLLANRPDVRQAERSFAQAFYATNAARAAFYPSLTLSGAVGWTNNGGGVVMNPGQWLLNAVGSLVQPLFNRGTNIANLKIAKARQEETQLQFSQSLLDAGKEVNDALVQWQTARKQIAIGEQRIAALQEAVRKTELLMRHSPTNYLEVLTAQQSLLDAQQAQSRNRFDEIQGVISLYHALGGGYF
ncbi:MAG: efflux transporter outer membrane subunit [Bacteroides sp.]|nr:efflux transporter outer membrane subunit [Bacteroides sp.]